MKKVLAVCAILLVLPLAAQKRKNEKEKKPTVAEKSTTQYIEAAKRQVADDALSEGSLFRPSSTFTFLAPDYKARNVNDLLVIHIVVATTSTASGAVKSARTFSANSSLTNLPIGKIGPRSSLQNLFSPNSSNSLNGQSATSSSNALNTDLTARVIAVLPNGVMLVEAVREVEMNNDRQTVIVRGMVRPGDVAMDNSVLSSALGNLEIELKGKGVISDGIRPPNKIVNAILKILGF